MGAAYLALALLVGSASAAAGDSPRALPAEGAWSEAAAKALIARADAGALATAAVLQCASQGADACAATAGRAAAMAPQNAVIGWVHLQLCASASRCDFRDAATVLRWVDADNGASWLPVLAAAREEKDGIEVERVLAAMAQATRFDLYGNRTVVLMYDVLRRARQPRRGRPSDAERLNAVRELVEQYLSPAVTPLLDACRPPLEAARHSVCLKLAATMQHSDAAGVQLNGFALEKRLSAADSKDIHLTQEHKHLLEWRISTAAQADAAATVMSQNSAARGHLALLRAWPREEDVCIAILRQHKISTEPPETHR